MWPQLSLQLMMGVGTPVATQVKVTVWPREAWMDCWGGVTTWGGTGKGGAGEKCFINSKVETWGVNQIESSGARPAPCPPSTIPALPPAPHSLQPNSSLRSGQSDSSSQWKLAGMQRPVETHWKCVGPHTSPGCLTAGDKAKGSEHRALSAWQSSSPVTFSRCTLGHSLHLAHFTHNASKTESNTVSYKATSL